MEGGCLKDPDKNHAMIAGVSTSARPWQGAAKAERPGRMENPRFDG